MNLDLLTHRLLRLPYPLHVRGDKTIGKRGVTIVFLHGLGGSGEMWTNIIKKMKTDNVRIITLDLIGFGKSPKPTWATYNTTLQAKSLRRTLYKLRVHGKVVIVGHSLGSLIAIETAKRYPKLASALVLCSPPLYRQPNDKALIQPERVLRKLFIAMGANPDQFVAITEFATKYKIAVNKSFNVTRGNVDIFLNALQAAILNQTAMDDIVSLNLPIDIVYGLVDPLVIRANLTEVAKKNKHIHLTTAAAGHEIEGLFEAPLVKTIEKSLSKQK